MALTSEAFDNFEEIMFSRNMLSTQIWFMWWRGSELVDLVLVLQLETDVETGSW